MEQQLSNSHLSQPREMMVLLAISIVMSVTKRGEEIEDPEGTSEADTKYLNKKRPPKADVFLLFWNIFI